MWRTVPVLSLAGCLWIGGGAHEERKAQMAIELEVGEVTPDAWSTCLADPPKFQVDGTVEGIHAGQSFDAWFQVDGDQRRDVGVVVAGASADGRAEVSFTIDLEETLSVLPACAGACPLVVAVGLQRLDLEDVGEALVQIVDAPTPALAVAGLAGLDDRLVPFASIPLSDNPAGSWSTSAWPSVIFEVADPHLPVGLGGAASVYYCPEGVDPIVSPELCLTADALAVPDGLTAGDMAFRAPTEGFGDASCGAAALAPAWRLFGVLREHVCGGPYVFPLTPAGPIRLVRDDCDDDGSLAPADCDDDDPSRSPGFAEVWYDGVDSDCGGGSDFDQDGDGSDSDVLPSTGDDCNDTDPTVSPLSLEVCDGQDNNCDGAEPTQLITWYSAGNTTNETDLSVVLTGAVDFDTILLCPGTYTGNFQIRADVTLASGDLDPSTTVLESGSPGLAVLEVGDPSGAPTVDVTVRGLGIRGAQSVPVGGGVDGRGALNLVIEDSDIGFNTATQGAGLAGAAVTTVRRTAIHDNAATQGGGVLLLAGTSLVLEEGSAIDTNDATDGGGLYIDTASVTADATSTVSNNGASGDGGGVWAIGDLTWSGATISGNVADAGGGFWLGVSGGTTWDIAEAVISDHDAPALLDGAGIYASGEGVLELTNTVLRDNSAGGSGGGIYAVSTDTNPIEVSLVNVTALNNIAAWQGGGLAADHAIVDTRSGSFDTNTATHGAGVHGIATSLELGTAVLGTDILDNVATLHGGGVRLIPGSQGDSILVGSTGIVDGNTAEVGGGFYLDGGGTDADPHALTGGEVTANDASSDGGGLYVTGAAFVQFEGGVLISGNTPQGALLEDEQARACAGIQVDDAIENGGGQDQGSDTECFLVTTSLVDTSTCGC